MNRIRCRGHRLSLVYALVSACSLMPVFAYQPQNPPAGNAPASSSSQDKSNPNNKTGADNTTKGTGREPNSTERVTPTRDTQVQPGTGGQTTEPGQGAAPAPAPPSGATGGGDIGGGGGGAPVDSKEYKIGPEDVLYVRVWREPDFTGSYTVHSDGKITMPLLGDLSAANMTPIDVEKEVTQALKKYIVNPIVTVTVQAVVSRRYYMDGEIARPGEYALPAPVTVLEAISRAGGLRDFANGKKIVILRNGQRIPFNYKEVTHGKNLDQNIAIQPGDHIIIP